MRRSPSVVSLVLTAVVLTALLAGCGGPKDRTEAPSGTAPARASQQDAGATVQLAKKQMLLVTLPANPSTGYMWEITAMPSIVETVGEPLFNDAAGKSGGNAVGSAGEMTFTFRTLKGGKGTLELAYRRPWETGVPADATYSLQLEAK
ncbi:MAG: protease inhibitor I42 family protein [Coriobacteriia bacterium]|nr:protease inhibitor I42 family protein [Coriobacteriia bacterium]